MTTALVAFVSSLLVAAVLTPMVRELARRAGAFDQVSSRKVHGRPIPRLGGMAIVTAFFVPLTGLLWARSEVGRLFLVDSRLVIGIFVGGGLVAALGVYDDLKGAGARLKFAVQFGAAGLVYAFGYRIEVLANPFGAPIELGWLGLPFTLLWIVGVINAINLVDGLDGLAGGVALVSVVITFVAAVLHGEPLMALFSAALAGAILGFLLYNFNPASIFMGDTGSMFLGFVLATSAIQTHQKSSTAVGILVPIVALGFPIADTLLAMTRRAVRGVPLFHADRDHIHHRLLARGFTHRSAVLALYTASLVLGGVALLLASAQGPLALALLVGLGLGAGLLLRYLGYMRVERAGELLQQRRRNLELRRRIREVGEQLRRATCPEDVWAVLKTAVPALGAESMALEFVLYGPEGVERRAFTDGEDLRQFRTRHSLLSERPTDGRLELGWPEDRASLDRDTEIAIELLCERVQDAVDRLDARAQAGVTPIRSRMLASRPQPRQRSAANTRR